MGLLKSLFSLLKESNTTSSQTIPLNTNSNNNTELEVLVQSNPMTSHLSHAYVADDSMFSGYMFCATLQPATPLAVLEHHGEVSHSGKETLPIYGSNADGIWTPRLKTWKDLGINLEEIGPSTMASAIGQIPQNGGEYLPFLKDVRRTVEANDTINNRIKALRLVLREKKYAKFIRKHEGQNQIIDFFFPRIVDTVPGVTKPIALALRELKITTIGQLRKQTDPDLLAIKGLGPASVKKIREFTKNYCGDDTVDRLDNVRR